MSLIDCVLAKNLLSLIGSAGFNYFFLLIQPKNKNSPAYLSLTKCDYKFNFSTPRHMVYAKQAFNLEACESNLIIEESTKTYQPCLTIIKIILKTKDQDKKQINVDIWRRFLG